VHLPTYTVENFREQDRIMSLGETPDGQEVTNQPNFPEGPVSVTAGETVYEIANPFPFRGTTYLLKRWADEKAQDPQRIGLPAPQEVSLTRSLGRWRRDPMEEKSVPSIIHALPSPCQLALAATSTDAADLTVLADLSCEFVRDAQSGLPIGLRYESGADGAKRPLIRDRDLFEVTANNPHLPEAYREVMVLRPGVQGGSEIVGEHRSADGKSHIWEYHRGNSYIPWGHFAANMAQDSVRYRIADLTAADMSGLRHLYYQRTYAGLAGALGICPPATRRPLSIAELEALRMRILDRLADPGPDGAPMFSATLWGWNFGFDYTPSRYRLHASHQQIHQQFALLPATVPAELAQGRAGTMAAYACGDQVQAFTKEYRRMTGRGFFESYIRAIRSNGRMDGLASAESSLVVHEDAHCMVFVPKAQTSQWELSLMTLQPVGNILEADAETRRCLDRAILVAVKVLSALGARMITTFETAKRLDEPDTDQRLLYTFLPRLPESPGAFSEAQLRWINGHYPEDFAAACRRHVPTV
jgi:hypothetical protein